MFRFTVVCYIRLYINPKFDRIRYTSTNIYIFACNINENIQFITELPKVGHGRRRKTRDFFGDLVQVRRETL